MFKGVLASSLSLLGGYDDFLVEQMDVMVGNRDGDTGLYGIAWDYYANETLGGREEDDICTAQIAALMGLTAGENVVK